MTLCACKKETKALKQIEPPPAPPKAVTQGPKITLNEAEALGRALEQAVQNQNAAEFETLLDLAAMVAHGMPQDMRGTAQAKEVTRGILSTLSGNLLKNLSAGDYRFLSVEKTPEGAAAHMRLIPADGSLNYHRLTIGRNAAQQPVAVDVYVYVTGEITKPQSILLTDKKLSLVDAILDSGYIKDQKSFDKKALLKRKGVIYVIDLYSLLNEVNDELNIFLQEEDILHIQKKSEDTVYVFGEAGQGTYPLYNNSSLTKLLTNAKINQVTADTDKIYVIRESLTSPMEGDVYQLKAKNPNTLLLANQFNLLPGDVIFVSPANIVRWNRVISLITPQSGIFTTYKDINATLESEFESGIAK